MITTARLVLRQFELNDASFILELLNTPLFIRFIGDKRVRTEEDAQRYLSSGPIASYDRHGFGLYGVHLVQDPQLLGMCGLLKRESLDDPDIGFAFLPAHHGLGYAFESASAVMEHARRELGIRRIVAIMSPENERSERLLIKLGMVPEGLVTLAKGEKACTLFASQ